MFGRVWFSVAYAFVFMVFCMAQMASAADTSSWRPHITFNLGSHHLNANRDFNEFNPGLGVGLSKEFSGFELSGEIGQYHNSLDEQSQYAMASVDREIARFGQRTAWRMGGFAGFARYPSSSNKFKDHGVPTFGDWVLGVGLQTTFRFDDKYDLRLRVMPAGHVADALFTAQFSIRF